MNSVDVLPAEYNRLLGYPREHELEGRALELAEWSRQWYREHGHPLVWTRHVENLAIEDDAFRLEGQTFRCERLRRMLHAAEASGAILAAVSAGPEIEEEAQRLWTEQKPDEYFFLETYGSAVVENLVADTGKRLCDWGQGRGLAVLPHYSPGYPEWDIQEQARLLGLLEPVVGNEIEALESGALRPKKSLLALFGLTRKNGVAQAKDSVPCQTCALPGCEYRRAPMASFEYATNRKALKRWAAERLQIERCPDHSIRARFRFDGTTCTNMGRPLAFLYDVRLGPREEGYPILEERCFPAPEDTGHRFMCQYLKEPLVLMAAIEDEKPLLGQPLENIITWRRAATTTGCYCDPTSREHKWGLVLETIHYALH